MTERLMTMLEKEIAHELLRMTQERFNLVSVHVPQLPYRMTDRKLLWSYAVQSLSDEFKEVVTDFCRKREQELLFIESLNPMQRAA